MPVQPQFLIGPLGQPAPPDGNQIPAQADGNARYVRGSPPGIFWPASPIQSSTGRAEIVRLSYSQSSINRANANKAESPSLALRKAPGEYSFGDLEDPSQPELNDFAHLLKPSGPAASLSRNRQDTPAMMEYPPLSAETSIDFHRLENGNHTRDEFHVIKEDFPALPRIPGTLLPEEEEVHKECRQPPTSQATADLRPVGALAPENYDLKSFIKRWSSSEFCEAYRMLNFDDLVHRAAKLHPLGECATETITRALPIENLFVGVNVSNQCTLLREPEDLRNEDANHRFVRGHKVAVLESDKYYAMSDALKDKLRNPRLQMLDELTLFFLFYFFTRDTQQLIAADALFQRNWRWNKRISRWCRFERSQQQGMLQVGVFQVYDLPTNRIQTISFPYSAHDFELSPPVIPPPNVRTPTINYEEKL
ncbi:uncharacterized protein LOC100907052 [Galendromus occidentalis]|uniref:Uncharacterized protein LOC100907052 n=1 Tax=Galendromus occidentalis TaxID=34638 RepID=A0AAJ6QZ41_9ACAR|nr:uncharacterized protein LOC100907052 [Galendromus occidentalis]